MSEEEKSDYPELESPNIEPHIPEHLLENLTPEMRHLIEQNSIQNQYMGWVLKAIVDTNKQVRKTNGRLKKVETWKSKMTHFGTIVIAAFVLISSIVGGGFKLYELFIR